MRLRFHPHELILRHVFRTSYEERHTQKTLIVSLSEDHYTGYGEATENRFYGASVSEMQAMLDTVREDIEAEGFRQRTPEQWHDQLKDKISSFALCALDEAMHDLYGKQKQKPLYELWGLNPNKQIVSSFTIGLDTPEVMLAKMRECPWPVYKIKLGCEDDMHIVRLLREKTNARFRIDANGAWSADETIEKSPLLKAWGVEFIEQPLGVEDTEAMKKVREKSVLPVIADESCQNEEDVMRCVDLFDGINIKLTKCGGLTAARRMIEKARLHGLKVMIGCMVESSVGISAIAQLLPLLDYVDMDGAMLIKNDPATGVQLTKKGVRYAENTNGTGVQLK